MSISAAQWDEYFIFSGHAYQQFVQRAEPEETLPRFVEDCMKELVVAEGRFVAERPRWAKSTNTATSYIQVADFLLLILQPQDEKWKVVTVLNGGDGNSWARAYNRGWTSLPPRPRKPRYAPEPPTLRTTDALWHQSATQFPSAPTPAISKPEIPSVFSIRDWGHRRRLLKGWREQKVTAARQQEEDRARRRSSWCWEHLRAEDERWVEIRRYREEFDEILWPAYQAAFAAACARTRGATAFQ